MALSPQRRKELKAYLAQCPGVRCRLTNRHDFPLPMDWGKTDNLTLSYNRSEGAYRLIAFCERDCGAELTYGVDKSTGVPVRKRAVKNTKPEYKWLGGDGYPMTREERAYLLALVLEEAAARKPVPRTQERVRAR
jgi:hypothetical protein